MQPRTRELRRERRQGEARRLILDAAERLLLEEGLDGFTMRKLARRCGYTAPTLYHYFGDKKGLIDQLLEEAFRGLVKELERVPYSPDPLDTLRAQFHAIVRFGLENPKHYRLLFTAAPEDAPVPSSEEARHRLEAPLDALFASGRLRLGDLEAARQVLWALLHGLISLQTSRPDVDWTPQLAALGLEAMLAGLLAPEHFAGGRP